MHLSAVNESKRKIGVKLVGCPYSNEEFEDLQEYNDNVIEFKAERRRYWLQAKEKDEEKKEAESGNEDASENSENELDSADEEHAADKE